MSGDELPRDAHLRAALRHAPDRELAPPAALSREILAAARAAVAPPPWPQRAWAAVMAGLDALRRPAAGAVFASLVLATVIGLMWRDGPPPEADAPPAGAVRPAAPMAGRADVPPAVAPEAPAAVTPAQPARDSATPRAAERPAPLPRAREATLPPAAQRSEAPVPAAAVSPPPAVAAAPSDTAQDAGLPPAAPAAPAVAPTAPRAEAAAAEGMAGATALQKSAARAAPAVADPLARVIAALDVSRDTTDPARLRSADAALAPRADLMRLWLADLQRSARGRWAVAEAAPPETGTAVTGRDGAVLGQAVIGADAAWWQGAEPGAPWWRAPLPDADLQRLRAGLQGWSAPR